MKLVFVFSQGNEVCWWTNTLPFEYEGVDQANADFLEIIVGYTQDRSNMELRMKPFTFAGREWFISDFLTPHSVIGDSLELPDILALEDWFDKYKED